MNDFVFRNRTHFYFGHDGIGHVADEIRRAKKVMITYGGGSAKRTGVFDQVAAQARSVGAEVVEFGGIMANPTLSKVMDGARVAREQGVDYIVAVGGGSVMDCSKMIALAAVDYQDGDADAFWDKYFTRRSPVEVDPVPLGIVVTAWGTGSEGNGGAVITNEKTKVKTGADRPQTNARFAIQDPELTYSVPARQKAAGGYDQLNHMMEEYFSAPVGDVIADDLLEAAMRSTIRNLPRVLAEGEPDYQAYANVEWASSLAENGILKSGKQTCFQCHMIEHQVGAYTDCIHGFGLAAITTNYYRTIYDASPEATYQFKRFATNVWGVESAGKTDQQVALEGIEALEAWTKQIGAAHTLSELGFTEEMLEPCAASIVRLPSGFKQLTLDDVRDILRRSM